MTRVEVENRIIEVREVTYRVTVDTDLMDDTTLAGLAENAGCETFDELRQHPDLLLDAVRQLGYDLAHAIEIDDFEVESEWIDDQGERRVAVVAIPGPSMAEVALERE